MSFASRVFYTGITWTTTTYNFSFDYLDSSYVKVYINKQALPHNFGSGTISYTVSTGQITLVNNNSDIELLDLEIRRETSQAPLVNFVSGTTLTESDLDTVAQQSLHLSVESKDNSTGSITLNAGGTFLDADSKQIKNLASGTLATDAVNKSQLDATDTIADTNAADLVTLKSTNIGGAVKYTLADDYVGLSTVQLPNNTTIENVTFGGKPGSAANREYVDAEILSVTLGDIPDGSIITAKLADDAVTTGKIAPGAVTADDILNDAVTNVKIVDNAVTTAKIVDSNITLAKMADNSVGTAELVDDSVIGQKIADDSIAQYHVLSNTVINRHILNGNVTTDKIADSNITLAKMADDSVDTAELIDDSVTTAKILDANVTTAKIADLQVTEAKLAADSVTALKIASGAVGNTEIAANSISTSSIANLQVTTAKLAADAVTAGKLADDAVVTANIVDANVTLAKMANDSVNTSQIVDGAVDNNKIKNGSVSSDNLNTNSVTTIKILDANVTTPKIADVNVTTAKIADDAVTNDKLAHMSYGAMVKGTAVGPAGPPVDLTAAQLLAIVDTEDKRKPKAFGELECNASPAYTGFNIASVTRVAEGVYTVAFTDAMSSANYVVMAQILDGATARTFDALWTIVQSKTTAGFTVVMVDAYAGQYPTDKADKLMFTVHEYV